MPENTTSVRGVFSFRPDRPLHLGHAFCAMLAWASVRSQEGEMILRLRQPKKSGLDRHVEQDLLWLGLDWDEGGGKDGPYAPYEQAQRADQYDRYFYDLEEQGLVYPCFCELPKSAGEMVYDGNCRNLSPELAVTFRQMRQPVIRIKLSDKPITFVDGNLGTYTQRPAISSGDFIVKQKGGAYSHRFADPVDDFLMGVTEVVRGMDQLALTGGQIELLHTIGRPVPQLYHAPMLLTESGTYVSKEDTGITIHRLREKGHDPRQIMGWLAFLAGLIDCPEPVSPKDLLEQFSWRKVPKENIALPHAFF